VFALQFSVVLFNHLYAGAGELGNGEDIALRVREAKPEVVLLDIGMPGMDGYEVARRIRQGSGSKDLRLIALTGCRILQNGSAKGFAMLLLNLKFDCNNERFDSPSSC